MEPVTIEEVQRKATILCLDVPQGTELGIDYHSWNCGPQFKGIKLIPPGIHFLYYNSINKVGGESAPRTGFFLVLKSGEVSVLRWNPQTEDFYGQEEMDEDEVERFAEGVKRMEFDAHLGAYPHETYTKWLTLSSWITIDVLKQLEPIHKKISSIYEEKGDTEKTQTSKTSSYYSDLSVKKVQAGNTPEQLTKLYMDKTPVLMDIIQKRYTKPTDILGELQFAFITFLMGQSFDGFEQWKQLVALLCSCEEALGKLPDLYFNFIGAFHFQLEQVPEDFFVDIISGNNFLVHVLRNFFELLRETPMESKVTDRANKLKAYVKKRFDMDFDIVWDDEDAPIVVEM